MSAAAAFVRAPGRFVASPAGRRPAITTTTTTAVASCRRLQQQQQRLRRAGRPLFAASSVAGDVGAGAEAEPVAAMPPPAAPSPDLAPVEIELGHRCEFGQRFAIVGDCDTLGSWDVSHAAPLEWRDGDVWAGVVALPLNRKVEFKPVVVASDGGECVAWADEVAGGPGRNLSITVTEGAEGAAGAHVELLPETSGERRPYVTARLPAAIVEEIREAAALEDELRAFAGVGAEAAPSPPPLPPLPLDADAAARLEAVAATAPLPVAPPPPLETLAPPLTPELAAENAERLAARGGGGGSLASADVPSPPPPSPVVSATLEGAIAAERAAAAEAAAAVGALTGATIAVPPPPSELITARGDAPAVVPPSAAGGAAVETLLEVVPGTQDEVDAASRLHPPQGAAAAEPAAAAEGSAAGAMAGRGEAVEAGVAAVDAAVREALRDKDAAARRAAREAAAAAASKGADEGEGEHARSGGGGKGLLGGVVSKIMHLGGGSGDKQTGARSADQWRRWRQRRQRRGGGGGGGGGRLVATAAAAGAIPRPLSFTARAPPLAVPLPLPPAPTVAAAAAAWALALGQWALAAAVAVVAWEGRVVADALTPASPPSLLPLPSAVGAAASPALDAECVLVPRGLAAPALRFADE